MGKIGFNNEKYIQLQSEKIVERISSFGGKLYLEFGGKLFDDYHASRVLPGFCPDSKIKMLLNMKDKAETIVVVSAPSIEQNKMRGDLGITYDMDALRLIDAFNEAGISVAGVVITQYTKKPAADAFIKRLENLGIPAYRHYPISGYPSNVKMIVSDEGFGKNEYIETTKPLVVITAPGPGSGKMATCLSQLYHDHKRGVKAGYAKFETFPIWNLPLKHPVNMAYEAATLDLNDVNMIDPFHLEATGITTVNYNRDIEVFPVLKAIFEKIYGECPYKSPTDMGVNMVGYCIVDDDAAVKASRAEIIRRYFNALGKMRKGESDGKEANKIELIMRQAGISLDERPIVKAAREKEEQTDGPAAAIELPDGRIVTGKTTSLLGAASAALINALKLSAGIPDSIKLMSKYMIEPIQELKTKYYGSNPLLHIDEIMIALSVCAIQDSNAAAALEQLPKLRGSDMHSSVILSTVDLNSLRKLGLNVTCEPKYETNKFYND